MTEETDGAADAVTNETPVAELPAQDVETPEAVELAEEDGDLEAQPGETEAQAKARRKQSLVDRNKDLTWRLRETERREQALLDRLAQQPPAQAPQIPAAQDDGRPNPANYADGAYDPAYIDALTDWKADQAVERKLAQREQTTKVQTAVQTFDQRADELFPDGEPEGLERFRSIPTVAPAIQEVIMVSEIGPKLADHLGAHPRELTRITALSPLQQVRELTKLELKLASPPAPTPKTATDAPAPTPQVRGAGGRFTVAPDTDDFAAFEKQYGKA